MENLTETGNLNNNPSSSSVRTLFLIVAAAVLGFGAGWYYCTYIGNQNAQIDIEDKLITNGIAIDMINNFTPCDTTDNTVSGHLELDVLLAYIDKMSSQCQSIGIEMSGLEYYFARYLEGEKQAGQRTILFYPTYKDSIAVDSINHVPFDPFSSMDIVNMNNGSRNKTTDDVKCVLDKSNMSPPRQATF